MASILPALEGDGLGRQLQFLQALALKPPQSMLLEGGTEKQRLQMGQYWAMTANCPVALAAKSQAQKAIPCLECSVCRQIAAFDFADLFIFDGRISNAQDEENPGPVRSLRMDNIRDLKIILGTSPNGGGKRLVLLQGMTQSREEAMNSLLKILEEPSSSNLFVLLTSQRTQILSTLVSRSLTLTLPWTDCHTGSQEELPLIEDFARFLQSGAGFLEKILQKGSLDEARATTVLLECQKSLARIISGTGTGCALDKSLAGLKTNAEALALAHAWIQEAHNMISATVNPQRVLEAFACRIWELLKKQA